MKVFVTSLYKGKNHYEIDGFCLLLKDPFNKTHSEWTDKSKSS